MKKKVLTISIILLSLMMLLLLIKCQKSESGTSSKSSASQYTQSQSKGLTSSEINRLTVNALLRELKFGSSCSYDNIDPGSCTYSINKTGKEGPYTVVYGTVYYYDKYGQLTKGPGGYSGSFTVRIDGGGSTSCYIRR